MTIPFYKYHGTGNDFIIIDNRKGTLDQYPISLNQKLCNRRLGIGADGLILLQSHAQYDFEMIYYNADGSQSLCGNGSRCAVHLAQYWGMIDREACFLTIDGTYQAFIQDNLIYLRMHDVAEIQPIAEGYFLDTGSPHYIRFVDDLTSLDVRSMGRAIRYSQAFQKVGTNVSFVQLEANSSISVRTYERGVEDETLSCGTGATAAALVASTKGVISPVHISTRGGKLQVSFQQTAKGYTAIYLIGPAAMVFQGTINTSNLA
ncbi:MAG: diaminopimelate epimerase [Bacteroidota bacterium]